MKTVIIDYGAGNIQSVKYALNRLGIEPILTKNHDIIKSADKVIFPGVGAADSAMKQLKSSGLHKLIPKLTQPVLGICVGMQLMCKTSKEGDVDCLGIIDVEVKKFEKGLKIPHMGWNNIQNIKTVVIVAHRFASVKNCHKIYFIDKGRIIDSGTFDELIKKNELFRRMANANIN